MPWKKECQTLKDHRQENDGPIDLSWLEEHIKVCSLCQKKMSMVREFLGLGDAIEESGTNE